MLSTALLLLLAPGADPVFVTAADCNSSPEMICTCTCRPKPSPTKTVMLVAAPMSQCASPTCTSPICTSPIACNPAMHPLPPVTSCCPEPEPECDPVCCPTCCCPTFWVRGEYLYWCVRGSRVPPLATFSPPGTPRENAGVLGSPGTTILYGDERINKDTQSGWRIDAGTWIGENCNLGIQGGYFRLGGVNDQFIDGDLSGNRIVSRPFVNALTGQAAAELVSFPGVLGGTVRVDSSTNVSGADALMRCALCCDTGCCCGYRVDLLTGYRYLSLEDDLRIVEDLFPLDATAIPGTNILLNDYFSVRNQFHGAVIGLGFFGWEGPLSLEVNARLGIGAMVTRVNIEGSTRISAPGAASVITPGGLLTQVSNIGRYNSTDFSVVPELEVRGGVLVFDGVRFTVGYNLIVMTNVARAGEQIDPQVNPNFLPPAPSGVGPQRPAFDLQRTSAYLQGLTLGIEVFY